MHSNEMPYSPNSCRHTDKLPRMKERGHTVVISVRWASECRDHPKEDGNESEGQDKDRWNDNITCTLIARVVPSLYRLHLRIYVRARGAAETKHPIAANAIIPRSTSSMGAG